MFEYERKGKVIEVKLENGKVVKISAEYVDRMVAKLDINEDDAVFTWLEDEGYLVNDEQEALCNEAKENKVKVTAERKVKQPVIVKNKEHKVKENPTKEMVIAEIAKAIGAIEGAENINIENKAKLITFTLNGEDFKIDLVQKRKAKEVKGE